MDSNPQRKPGSAFEYFLYVAIVAETGLAALVYKFVFGNPELARMRVGLALFYFAFLAWAIAQLNLLHRDRNPSVAEPARNPEPAAREIPEDQARPAGRLTMAQLVIVAVVFVTAVATFTWALRLLN